MYSSQKLHKDEESKSGDSDDQRRSSIEMHKSPLKRQSFITGVHDISHVVQRTAREAAAR